MSVLFAGGTAMLRRVAIRFVVYSYFRGGGLEYDCSGRDDYVLNHKHYFNCNSTVMNGCSAQC